MERDDQGSSFGRGTVGNLAGSAGRSPPGSTTALPHHTEIARDERELPTDLELVLAQFTVWTRPSICVDYSWYRTVMYFGSSLLCLRNLRIRRALTPPSTSIVNVLKAQGGWVVLGAVLSRQAN